jgi:hypothetical protein
MPCLETVAVESPRDDIVAGDQRQGAHSLDDVGRRAVALSAPPAWQPVLGMDSADPVDGQHDLGRGVIEARHGCVSAWNFDPLSWGIGVQN